MGHLTERGTTALGSVARFSLHIQIRNLFGRNNAKNDFDEFTHNDAFARLAELNHFFTWSAAPIRAGTDILLNLINRAIALKPSSFLRFRI